MSEFEVIGTQATGPVPVAVVGASAGGLEALRALFTPMSADTGIAFVVVQHRLAGHESLLVDLIAQATRLPVAEGVDGTVLQADHIFVAPAGSRTVIQNRHLRVDGPADDNHGLALPIDQALHSLAWDVGDGGIAIILSGGGSDGTNGLRAVKEAGGLVLVQDPATAGMDSMPRHAIDTGLADFVLSADSMAAKLGAFAQEPYLSGAPLENEDQSSREHVLSRIIALLLTRTKLSFH